MLITVILTTYKRPKLLARAIDSVFAQRCEPGDRFELIVSDDDAAASARKTVEAAANKLSSDDDLQLRYIVREGVRGGVSRSRNRALAIARGDWVLFLDDDDMLAKGALSALMAGARTASADFCAGQFQRVREDGEGNILGVVDERVRWSGYDQLLISNVFPMGAFVLRRSAISSGFNINLRTHEDWLFLLDNLQDLRISVIDDCVLQIHEAVDVSREHRNLSGGLEQKAADYARIYALHPAPHLLKQRREILRIYGSTSLEKIIGGSTEDPAQSPLVVSTDYGVRWLEAAGSPLREGGLDAFTLPIVTVTHVLKPGAIVDVCAGDVDFSIAIARALPDVPLICLERSGEGFMRLCANLLLNGVHNALAVNMALTANEGEQTALPRVVRDDGSLRFVWRSRLDGLQDIGALSLIRFRLGDSIVEDFRGAASVVNEQHPLIYVSASASGSMPGMREAMLALLFEAGYAVLQIQDAYFAYHPSSVAPAALAPALASVGVFMPGMSQ